MVSTRSLPGTALSGHLYLHGQYYVSACSLGNQHFPAWIVQALAFLPEHLNVSTPPDLLLEPSGISFATIPLARRGHFYCHRMFLLHGALCLPCESASARNYIPKVLVAILLLPSTVASKPVMHMRVCFYMM